MQQVIECQKSDVKNVWPKERERERKNESGVGFYKPINVGYPATFAQFQTEGLRGQLQFWRHVISRKMILLSLKKK